MKRAKCPQKCMQKPEIRLTQFSFYADKFDRIAHICTTSLGMEQLLVLALCRAECWPWCNMIFLSARWQQSPPGHNTAVGAKEEEGEGGFVPCKPFTPPRNFPLNIFFSPRTSSSIFSGFALLTGVAFAATASVMYNG